MSNHQSAQMGADAVAALDNPAYKLGMKMLREQLMDELVDWPIRDREGQFLLLQLAKISKKFEGILYGLIESGKFAQRQIDIDSERDESKARKLLRRVYG